VLQKCKTNKANFDLERLISKIASGMSPREVVYLKESLDAITYIKHGL
jgi:hypothetical protein